MGEKRRLRHSTRPDVEPLSFNDIRFCQLYAATGEAAKSYHECGHKSANLNSAGVSAHRLLRNVKIREYIRLLRQQAADAARVTVDELAVGFCQVAYADRTGILNDDGTVRPPSQWPAELKSLITGVEVIPQDDGTNRYKVKFERSMEARKVLAQWRGMIGSDKTAKVIADTLKVLSGIDEGKV